jgi:predicted MFS family arabinose efflux permease
MVADAFSFVFSAVLLWRIRLPERPASRVGQSGSIWRDMLVGLKAVAGEPVLRAMAITGAVSNLFAYIQAAVLVLYVTRDLGLPATAYGLMLSGFGLGGVCGALVGPRVAGRVGYGGAIACGVALMASGNALVAFSGPPLALAGMVPGQVLTGFGLPLCTISMISLRQSITPRELLGRINATTRLMSWGVLPLGALLGGALGEAIGIRPTLVLSAAGSALVVLWVLVALTPATRKLTVTPTPARP